MVWLSLLALALALSMDAMAVSAARALGSTEQARLRDASLMALFFGVAQGLMPLIGAFLGVKLGTGVGAAFAAWDHWIAFVLLVFIGGKMVREAMSNDDADADARGGLSLKELTLLAIATSIDAFAAGITLPMLGLPILASALGIGVVTGALSFLAAWFSRALAARFGERFATRLEVLGGVILILLGVRVLLEHLAG